MGFTLKLNSVSPLIKVPCAKVLMVLDMIVKEPAITLSFPFEKKEVTTQYCNSVHQQKIYY